MDLFKQKLTDQCGKGGLYCDCCNTDRSIKGHKNSKRQIARKRLKNELHNQLNEFFINEKIENLINA